MAKLPNVTAITAPVLNIATQASTNDRLTRALQSLSLIATPSQHTALSEYLLQLLRWNKTYNLTAIRKHDQALVHHIFDSLTLVNPISEIFTAHSSAVQTVVDVGSGGGLPGIVLAIMLPSVRVICVDAVEKKTIFIRQMAGVLALPNLTAQHARVETLEPLQSLIVTSRAFSSLADFAHLAGRHVKKGGYMLAMKGQHPNEEIDALQALTPWFVQAVQPLIVPELESQRCLVLMRRKGNE